MYFDSCLKVGRGNRGSGPSAGKCWWAGFSRFHSRMLDGDDGIVFVLLSYVCVSMMLCW